MEDKIRNVILEHSYPIDTEINSDGEGVYTDDRRIDDIDINVMVKKIMAIIAGGEKSDSDISRIIGRSKLW